MEEIAKEAVKEKNDSRTVIGKRLQKLEDAIEAIQKQLAEHKKRIDICSIKR